MGQNKVNISWENASRGVLSEKKYGKQLLVTDDNVVFTAEGLGGNLFYDLEQNMDFGRKYDIEIEITITEKGVKQDVD